MSYKLTLEETETTVIWNAKDKEAQICTCDPKVIKKLDKLVTEYPEQYRLDRIDTCEYYTNKYYIVPKKLIAFKKPRINTALTEEQKEKARDRFYKNIGTKQP